MLRMTETTPDREDLLQGSEITICHHYDRTAGRRRRTPAFGQMRGLRARGASVSAAPT
jgi:hypothetical protein